MQGAVLAGLRVFVAEVERVEWVQEDVVARSLLLPRTSLPRYFPPQQLGMGSVHVHKVCINHEQFTSLLEGDFSEVSPRGLPEDADVADGIGKG